MTLSISIDIQSHKTRKEAFLSKYCCQNIGRQFLKKLTHGFCKSVYVFLHQSSTRYYLRFSFAYKYNEEGEQGYFRDAVIDHFWRSWIVIYWKTVLWIVIVVHLVKHELPKFSIVYTYIKDQLKKINSKFGQTVDLTSIWRHDLTSLLSVLM